MKKLSLKTPLLALVIATSMVSVTACKDASPQVNSQTQKLTPATITATIADLQSALGTEAAKAEFENIKANVAPTAVVDIAQWIKEQQAVNGTAADGTAGNLARGEKTIPVNGQGFELPQLTKKSLIGAYHLFAAKKEIASLQAGANKAKVTANITEILLGSTDGDKAGNEFKKYLKKYAELHTALETAINEGNLEEAMTVANKAVAVRTAHYLDAHSKLDTSKTELSGDAAHSISEGLGFVYALQFATNPKTGKAFYTKAEADAFLADLNLWNKADAIEKLKTESLKIKEAFGLPVNVNDVTATIADLQSALGTEAAKAEFENIKANVAPTAVADITQWIKEQQAVSGTAADGTAGNLARGEKTIPVNGQGFELPQLTKKSLIGAYHLFAAKKEIASLEKDDAIAKVAANVQEILLGATDGEKAGNEFKKYLIKTDKVTKAFVYKDLKEAVENGIAAAEQATTVDSAKEELNKALTAAEKLVATRGAHYLDYGTKLTDEAEDFGNTAHGISEGLGFVYSLQFATNPKTGEAFYTKAEADAFLAGLNLWNKADAAEKLAAESVKVKEAFGLAIAAE